MWLNLSRVHAGVSFTRIIRRCGRIAFYSLLVLERESERDWESRRLTSRMMSDIVIQSLVEQFKELSPERRIHVIEQALSDVEIDKIKELERALATLRSQRSIVSGTTRLGLKQVSYQGKQTQYTYVYLFDRSSNRARSLGALFQTNHQYEYHYTSHPDGSISFSHAFFKLTNRTVPSEVRLIQLLKFDPPPPTHEFQARLKLTLHYRTVSAHLHQFCEPQTAVFPDCFRGGIFNRKVCKAEAIAPPGSHSESAAAHDESSSCS